MLTLIFQFSFEEIAPHRFFVRKLFMCEVTAAEKDDDEI